MMVSCPGVLLLLTVVLNLTATAHGHSIGVILGVNLGRKSLSRAVDKVSHMCDRLVPCDSRDRITWIMLNSTSPRHAVSTVQGMINEGVQVVVTVLRCHQKRAVSAITESSQIPHLSLDLDPCKSSDSEEFTLHLTQQYNNMAAVLLDIILATDVTQITLDFQTVFHPVLIQPFLVSLASVGIRAVLSEPRGYPKKQLSTVGRMYLMEYNSVSNTAEDGRTPTLVVTDRVPNDVSKLAHSHGNVVRLEVRPVPAVSTSLPFQMKADVPLTFSQKLLMEAFGMLFKTFDSMGGSTDEGLCFHRRKKHCLRKIEVVKRYKMICGAGYSNHCDYLLEPTGYELFDISEAAARNRSIGEWTKDKGLILHSTPPGFKNRFLETKISDFGGVTLKVGVDKDSPPFVSREPAGGGLYHGIMIDILNDLASIHNFKYELLESPDGKYGAKLSNGTWCGLVGMVSRREADLGVGSFTIDAERMEAVEFTTYFKQDSYGILTPTPREVYNLFQVFQPFNRFVWLALLLVVLLAWSVMVFIGVKTDFPTTDESKHNLRKSIVDNFSLILSSFLEQGPTIHPTTVTARCFLSFWFVFTILTMAMYTAHLAAVLTVSTPVRPINSVRDLAEQRDMRVVIREGGTTWKLFAQSKEPPYTTVASRMEAKKSPVADIIQAVKEGKVCFLADRTQLEYLASQSCGNVRLADERILGFSAGFIVPLHSAYKGALDASIQKMVESGLIEKIEQKWNDVPVVCRPDDSEGSVRPLTLASLGGVFVVYGIVSLGALCILSIELAIIRGRK